MSVAEFIADSGLHFATCTAIKGITDFPPFNFEFKTWDELILKLSEFFVANGVAQ